MNLKATILSFGFLTILGCCHLNGNNLFIDTDTGINKSRRNLCYAVGFGGTAVTHAALSQIWYKGYASSGFHFFNDNRQWLQMDKAGHGFSAYYLGVAGIEAAKWAGVPEKHQWKWALFGSIFQDPIEIWDGFSQAWGASAGDLLANTLGTTMAAVQHAVWKEQKVLMKYSFTPSEFAKIRPNTLGSDASQQFLKDYNGQTYWLCYHPLKSNKWDWLGLALGYGGNGMLGGEQNIWTDASGNHFDRSDVPRYRQYYLGFDYDLRKIKTNKKGLKVLLFALNCIKLPSPALEFSQNKFKFHAFKF